MATVINRVTKELRQSVNTPDYPADAWIINPDLSEVEGFDRKYWKIDADKVVLASEAERVVIDQAEEEARKNAVVDATLDENTTIGNLIKQFRAELAASNKAQSDIKAAISNAATLAGLRTAVQVIDIPVLKTDQEFRDSLKNTIRSGINDNLP